jgi:SEC-C motif-containing protein
MMSNEKCPCCSGKSFLDCCQPFILGLRKPSTPEELMRSRYSAYATCEVDYLYTTTATKEQKYYSKKEIERWSTENDWLNLEIVHSTENTVEFKASHQIKGSLDIQIHHELSRFNQEGNDWKYLDGQFF